MSVKSEKTGGLASKSKQKAKKKRKSSDNKVLSLIPKSRKRILRVFFSRIGLAVVLIILQLTLLYALFDYLRDYYEGFSAAFSLFALLMVFHLFSSDMDSTARLTWLLILLMAPIPGAVLMWFTETDIGNRAVKARINEIIDDTKDRLPQEKGIITRSEIVDSGTAALCKYLNRSGCFPIYENTQVKYFPLGEDCFVCMVNKLKKAKKFIFMEFFIISEGYMWGTILNILAEKVKAGVEVRVMYDGMCEISTLTSDYPKRLADLGIMCKPFSPIYPFLSTNYNYRDHRKILVIDGKTAFNGGINLADEYINKVERFGHWKDTAVMLEGEAVQSFTLMFLQMWNLAEQNVLWDEYLKPCLSFESDGFVMPYCDSPLDSFKVGESVYLDILNRAQRYVHIMTPYLILDNELETALKFAAQRGVDVKLILPGIPDKRAVFALAKSHYKYLEEAGVKIYEYSPGFVHAKVFVSDDVKAVVGTINLDYRSLYHHFECATYMYRSSCISDIENDFNETLTKCRKMTASAIEHESLYYKTLGSVMKLAAPLM